MTNTHTPLEDFEADAELAKSLADDLEELESFGLEDEDDPVLRDDGMSLAMFDGDTSHLFPEVRLCLVALLKHRYISAERHPAHWDVLLKNEAPIRSRLNELFFHLEVDREMQVAFKRQAKGDPGDDLPSLTRDLAHTKEETIILIHLRKRFYAQRAEGDTAVYVDRQTLLDEVSGYRPEDSTNRSAAHKHSSTAIESLQKAGLLLKTPDPDRFRISPVIESVMPESRMTSLLRWLMERNGKAVPAGDTPSTDPNEAPLFVDDGAFEAPPEPTVNEAAAGTADQNEDDQ